MRNLDNYVIVVFLVLTVSATFYALKTMSTTQENVKNIVIELNK
jgi:hypothetical protein